MHISISTYLYLYLWGNRISQKWNTVIDDAQEVFGGARADSVFWVRSQVPLIELLPGSHWKPRALLTVREPAWGWEEEWGEQSFPGMKFACVVWLLILAWRMSQLLWLCWETNSFHLDIKKVNTLIATSKANRHPAPGCADPDGRWSKRNFKVCLRQKEGGIQYIYLIQTERVSKLGGNLASKRHSSS